MVETIMAAVLGALASGAKDGLKDVAKSGLKDGYDKLKAALVRHGENSTVVSTALGQVEAKPESKARQAVLEEELAESGAANDTHVMAQATSLLELVRSLPNGGTGGQMASGAGIAQADRNSSATVNMTSSQNR
jgi:hypothetical protein